MPPSKHPRPPLPYEHANPYLRQVDPTRPPLVKFQEIMRDTQMTVVARLKIQTPTGHAFILRRLDTGAVSQTTMFRAAFPTASEELEKAETAWVKAEYDLAGANKAGKSRFAGTWVTPDVALTLATDYNLLSIVMALCKAKPDPNYVYRRSRNSGQQQQATPEASPDAAEKPPSRAQAPATPRQDVPPSAKRRREASPAQTIVAPSSPTLTPVSVTATTVVADPAVLSTPTPPPSNARRTPASPPTTRRSARLKSPAVSAIPTPVVPPKTPRGTRASRAPAAVAAFLKEAPTPTGSDETVVDEDAAHVAEIAGNTMEEDIREQKELIARLKAQREQEQRAKEETEQAKGDEMVQDVQEKPASKRPREDNEAGLKFDFASPSQEVSERAIATNSRVRVLVNMPPERKSLAWGALAFAAGLGAMSLLPTLQGYLPL